MEVPFYKYSARHKVQNSIYGQIYMVTYLKALAIVRYWKIKVIHMFKFISSSEYPADSKNYEKNLQKKIRANLKVLLQPQGSSIPCPFTLLLYVKKPWAISNWIFPHPHCVRQCWALIVRFQSFRGRPERLHQPFAPLLFFC